MKKLVLNPVTMFITGCVLGVLSKLFDIHLEVLGNIFSEFSIWILLGTLIAIYSDTKTKAMINVFVFCIGMLLTYYLTAEITGAVYGMSFVKGWAIFACASPLFAYFTWMTKEKGVFAKIISSGIIAVSIFCSVILFSLDIFDVIINIILIYYLFFKKVKRNNEVYTKA